jgi:hypothetical protein
MLCREKIALDANVDELLKDGVKVAVVGLGDGVDTPRLALGASNSCCSLAERGGNKIYSTHNPTRNRI